MVKYEPERFNNVFIAVLGGDATGGVILPGELLEYPYFNLNVKVGEVPEGMEFLSFTLLPTLEIADGDNYLSIVPDDYEVLKAIVAARLWRLNPLASCLDDLDALVDVQGRRMELLVLKATERLDQLIMARPATPPPLIGSLTDHKHLELSNEFYYPELSPLQYHTRALGKRFADIVWKFPGSNPGVDRELISDPNIDEDIIAVEMSNVVAEDYTLHGLPWYLLYPFQIPERLKLFSNFRLFKLDIIPPGTHITGPFFRDIQDSYRFMPDGQLAGLRKLIRKGATGTLELINVGSRVSVSFIDKKGKTLFTASSLRREPTLALTILASKKNVKGLVARVVSYIYPGNTFGDAKKLGRMEMVDNIYYVVDKQHRLLIIKEGTISDVLTHPSPAYRGALTVSGLPFHMPTATTKKSYYYPIGDILDYLPYEDLSDTNAIVPLTIQPSDYQWLVKVVGKEPFGKITSFLPIKSKQTYTIQ